MMHIQTCTTKTKLSQTVTVLCKFKEKVYKQTILIYKAKLKNKNTDSSYFLTCSLHT